MQFILQKKSLIFSIIFFLFSCFIFIFLYKNINKIKETLQIAQEKLQVETSQRDNIESLINSVKVIEPERILLENHFIKSSDIVPFLDTIEKLARNVEVNAEVISVDLPKDNPSMIVEMKAVGNFESIYKLITLLENSQYETEFVSVNIQNSNTGDLLISKNPQWSAILRIKLLSYIN
jgi:hypothetical protein